MKFFEVYPETMQHLVPLDKHEQIQKQQKARVRTGDILSAFLFTFYDFFLKRCDLKIVKYRHSLFGGLFKE